MKKIFTIILLLFNLLTISSQTIDLQTPALDQNSGLLFYNSKLISHNDSGGDASLYEIDTSTGAITRTVTISNATNVDWEDLTQDTSYIYIGDFGNNFGNRTNLRIYKISKDDYNNNDTVTAEIISYSYADQLDFTSNINNHNWDAEALISYGDKLLIFSKNWVDNKVNVYAIPKTSGTHIANIESTYNTNGLITGADTSSDESIIYLTGYTDSAPPFMYTIHNIPNNSLDVFTGTVSDKITDITPIGNQVEAIAYKETTASKHNLYISNEKFTTVFNSIPFNFPAKLRTIQIDVAETETLTISATEVASSFKLYQTPSGKTLKTNTLVDEIIIFDVFGRTVIKQQHIQEISLGTLNSGVYIAHVKVNHTIHVRKIIRK